MAVEIYDDPAPYDDPWTTYDGAFIGPSWADPGDISQFYDLEEFAVEATVTPADPQGVAFSIVGIFDTVGIEAFSVAMTTTHSMRYVVGPQLRPDDVLNVVQGRYAVVGHPRQINFSEMVVSLVKVS